MLIVYYKCFYVSKIPFNSTLTYVILILTLRVYIFKKKIFAKQKSRCAEEHSAAVVQQQHQVAPATWEPLASHPQLLSASCYWEEEGSGGSLLLSPRIQLSLASSINIAAYSQ